MTMGRAASTAPDTAARVFDLRLKTGPPPDVIERNLDAVEKQVASSSFNAATFRQQSPALASWLEQHPLNAAVSQDDLVPLSGMERALGWGRRLVADPAISLLKGAISLPEAGVGLLDIATLGRVGRGLEHVGCTGRRKRKRS